MGMNEIYELEKDRWVIFWERGTQLLMQYKEEERIGRPILLARDYVGGFRAAKYEGMLYYLYVNESGDVLLRNIRDNLIYYQIRHERNDEGGEASAQNSVGEVLGLHVYEGELRLWYLDADEKTRTKKLQCIFPLKPDKGRVVLAGIPWETAVHVSETEQLLVLLCAEKQSRDIYYVGNGLQLQKIAVADPTFAEEQRRRYTAALEEVQRLKTILQEKGQNLQDKDRQVNALQGMLESASRQYEELMHVAEQYRDEAIKWRSKFMF